MCRGVLGSLVNDVWFSASQQNPRHIRFLYRKCSPEVIQLPSQISLICISALMFFYNTGSHVCWTTTASEVTYKVRFDSLVIGVYLKCRCRKATGVQVFPKLNLLSCTCFINVFMHALQIKIFFFKNDETSDNTVYKPNTFRFTNMFQIKVWALKYVI